MSRFLSILLMVLAGAGLLVSWNTDKLLWHSYEALVYAALLVWTAAWVAGRTNVRWSWIFVPMAAIPFWGALQLALHWTVYPFATVVETLRWGAYAAVLFLSVQVFGRPRSARELRAAFSVYALILAVVSVFQWFMGNGKIFWIFASEQTAGLGPFVNRDHYSSFVALAIPMAFYAMRQGASNSWFYPLAIGVLYASSIAGGSRAGFVLLTVELALLLLLLAVPGRLAAALVGLVVIFGFVVGWEFLFSRLQENDPYSGRREVARTSVRMFREQPAHGFGLGTWTDVYPGHAEKDFGVFINAAHNDWLQWADDGGAPLLACFLALFLGSCALAYRVPWTVGVPVVFLHCGIDFPMQTRHLPVVVFLILGVGIRSAIEKRRDGRSVNDAQLEEVIGTQA